MATTFATPRDNASTTLGQAYTPGSGSVTVAAGDGPLFGSPSGTAPVRVTIVPTSAVDPNGFLTDGSAPATYLATGITGDTLTGLTLESGTDAPRAEGDFIALLIGARTIAEIHDAIHALEAGGGGGSGGATTFTFTQASPASTWTIAHNLGRHPSVTVVDSAGSVVLGDVRYDSADQVTVSFGPGGFSGQAFLN